jgi:hypothetical protein
VADPGSAAHGSRCALDRVEPGVFDHTRACQMVCVTVLSGLVSLWVRGYGLGRTRQVLRGLVSSRW